MKGNGTAEEPEKGTGSESEEKELAGLAENPRSLKLELRSLKKRNWRPELWPEPKIHGWRQKIGGQRPNSSGSWSVA